MGRKSILMVTENEVVLNIDRVRAMLGELKSMAHNYAELKRSRDRWKQFADERESELGALKAEIDACWAKLPTDTSGETIRPGDLLVDSDGVTFRANELVLRDSGWVLRYMGDDMFPVDTIHAEEQLTVEDVLEDCISDWENGRFESHEELAARHAERIRELLGVNDEEE